MNKSVKFFSLSLALAMIAPICVKADTLTNAQDLLNQALTQKTFYSYNRAYNEISKIQDPDKQNPLMWKLAALQSEVWTEDVKKYVALLNELQKSGSGKIYDELVNQIQMANMKDIDKSYLFGEISSWGKKLVWTEDYSTAVNTLMNAWSKQDLDSISKAEVAITNVKNQYSKKYLSDQLMPLRYKIESINIKNTYSKDDILRVEIPKIKIEKGEKAILPNTIVITMKDDSRQTLLVTWNDSKNINVNFSGLYSVHGKIDIFDINVELTVQIIEKYAQGNFVNQHEIAVSGDWIYYYKGEYNGDLDETGIYRIRKDGSEKQLVHKRNGSIYSLSVKNKYLEYMGIQGYHRVDLVNLSDALTKAWVYTVPNAYKGERMFYDEMKKSLYIGGASSLFRYRGMRFGDDVRFGYTHQDYLVPKEDLESDGRTAKKGSSFSEFTVDDDYIYYTKGEHAVFYWDSYSYPGIYKMNKDIISSEKISDDLAEDIHVIDDWIYYVQYTNGHGDGYTAKICKMKTDGSGKQEIVELGSTNVAMNVVGGWIYYADDHNGIYKIKSDGTDNTLIYKCAEDQFLGQQHSGPTRGTLIADDDSLYTYIITQNHDIRKIDLVRVSVDGTTSQILDSNIQYNSN
jgi:hypothetical protein